MCADTLAHAQSFLLFQSEKVAIYQIPIIWARADLRVWNHSSCLKESFQEFLIVLHLPVPREAEN